MKFPGFLHGPMPSIMQVWASCNKLCFYSCWPFTPVKWLWLCWSLSWKNNWTQWSNIIPLINLSSQCGNDWNTLWGVYYQAGKWGRESFLSCLKNYYLCLLFSITITLVKVEKICKTSLPNYSYLCSRKGISCKSPNSKSFSSICK